MDSPIRWVDTGDEEADDGEDTLAHGAVVDESVAQRRLRRWLKGMFGGEETQTPEPPEREPRD